MKGLEPPHLAASDPKSDVSTNFTTSGKNLNRAAKVRFLIKNATQINQIQKKNKIFVTDFIESNVLTKNCPASWYFFLYYNEQIAQIEQMSGIFHLQ